MFLQQFLTNIRQLDVALAEVLMPKTSASKPFLTLLALSLLGSLAVPAMAHQSSQAVLVSQARTSSGIFHSLPAGKVVPLVCDPDENPAVSANYINDNHQLTLQLNGAGDANDIVGAFVDGYAGTTFGSISVDFKGPCLPANAAVVPEGPNIFVIGNDAYGNGVLAVGNCTEPAQQSQLKNGFTREVFTIEALETVLSTGPTFYPLVKIIGLDIEASGLSEPLLVRNIRVNNQAPVYDVNPSDQIGCLPIYSPF